MKKIICMLTFLTSVTGIAQELIFSQTKITEARVYKNSAELTHEASIQVKKGNSELILTNIADYLNEKTVKISVPKYVTVMSVQFSNNYIEEYDNNKNSPTIKPIKLAIDTKTKELNLINNLITNNKKSTELLDKNQIMSNSKNFSVEELKKLLIFYKKERNELTNTLDDLYLTKDNVSNEIKKLKEQLNFNKQTNQKNSMGKLILNVMSTQEVTIPMRISYLTNQAGWSTNYDLRVENIKDPILLTYKAQVHQNTGLDWRNVKLSLTSGYANQNNQIPSLNPLFIDYEPEVVYSQSKVKYDQEVSQGAIENSSNSHFERKLQSRVKGISISTGKEASSLSNSTIALRMENSENELNFSFDIKIPYTVLSNNKNHSVAIKEIEIPANYEYTCIPKISSTVYLTAKIKDYGKYNILNGYAQVIFNDTYVGKTYIDTSKSDDLVLSLGKDSKLVVNRKRIKDNTSNRVLSSRQTDEYVYEITAKNNKSKKTSIKILDRVPISKNKDIEIEVTEKDKGTIDKETGIVTWNLDLNRNETKKIRLGYNIEYNEDKKIL